MTSPLSYIRDLCLTGGYSWLDGFSMLKFWGFVNYLTQSLSSLKCKLKVIHTYTHIYICIFFHPPIHPSKQWFTERLVWDRYHGRCWQTSCWVCPQSLQPSLGEWCQIWHTENQKYERHFFKWLTARVGESVNKQAFSYCAGCNVNWHISGGQFKKKVLNLALPVTHGILIPKNLF